MRPCSPPTSCSASATAGPTATPARSTSTRQGRKFIHVDIEPTQIGRVFAPDFGIVSDAGAALKMLLDVATEWKTAGRLRDWSRLGQGVPRSARRRMKRKTHFDQMPLKPQRVYEEMNKALRPRHHLRHDDRPQPDRRRAVPACLQAAQLDQLRPGGPARLDAAGGARRARRRPGPHHRRAVGRLRLPVHDRGTGGRRAAQAALSSMSS